MIEFIAALSANAHQAAYSIASNNPDDFLAPRHPRQSRDVVIVHVLTLPSHWIVLSNGDYFRGSLSPPACPA